MQQAMFIMTVYIKAILVALCYVALASPPRHHVAPTTGAFMLL